MLAQIAQGSASPGWLDGSAGASGTLNVQAGSEDVSAAAVAFSNVAKCRCPNDSAKWMTSATSASPLPIRLFERNQPIQAQSVANIATSLAHRLKGANGLSGQNRRKINEAGVVSRPTLRPLSAPGVRPDSR